MAKRKNKRDKKELKSIPILWSFPIVPEKVTHPNEEQEDPINGKFEKSIELDERGIGWR